MSELAAFAVAAALGFGVGVPAEDEDVVPKEFGNGQASSRALVYFVLYFRLRARVSSGIVLCSQQEVNK